MRATIGLLAAGLALAACTPIVVDPPVSGLSPQARWEAGQAAYLAWNSHRRGWTTTHSGLQYKCIQHGPKTGPKPERTSVVTIHYTGTFIDGRKFDSSRDRGEPATFPLNRLILGWQEGVPMMHVGDRCLFAIPANIAYGARYRDPIPANSALLFDIELLAIPEGP